MRLRFLALATEKVRCLGFRGISRERQEVTLSDRMERLTRAPLAQVK